MGFFTFCAAMKPDRYGVGRPKQYPDEKRIFVVFPFILCYTLKEKEMRTFDFSYKDTDTKEKLSWRQKPIEPRWNMSKQPPFTITNAMIDAVAEIAELVGKISVSNLSNSPTLRRTNRIRTIYGSLAIGQNTLSFEQVTAVLNGKRVLAPPKDIAEVKNAYEIYERLDELDPYSIHDLLMAHGMMMHGLIEEAGEFRSRPVGVVDQQGNILHFGTLPQYVPDLVLQLLEWTRDSDLHMLIRSCVFHYELELIHPFADGNGRIGRLWHTLLLSRWNPIFAWLPVESIIHDHQQAYYDAINQSNNEGESTCFITFMLSVIKASSWKRELKFIT